MIGVNHAAFRPKRDPREQQGQADQSREGEVPRQADTAAHHGPDHGAGRPVELVRRGIRSLCRVHIISVAQEEHAERVPAPLHPAAHELERRDHLIEGIGNLDQDRGGAIRAMMLQVPMTIGWMMMNTIDTTPGGAIMRLGDEPGA